MKITEQARLSADGNALAIVPTRHFGRHIASVVVVLLVLMMLNSVVRNERFGWDIVGQYLFSQTVLEGLFHTVWLMVICMTLGTVIGMVVAIGRLSSVPSIRIAAWGYCAALRSVPLLVQLIFWFNLSALYPRIQLSIPFGPTLFDVSGNDIITPFSAAVLALSLHESAYMAEIIRAGIISVASGQRTAATALGMTRFQMMRLIILPQAIGVIIPPAANQAIHMLKQTALVSVIAMPDLLYSVQIEYARNFAVIPLLIVASIWYLVMTTLLSLVQIALERRFGSDR